MRSLAIAIVVLVPLALGALGCGKNSQPPPPSSGSPNAQPESGPSRPRPGGDSSQVEQARQTYAMWCAMCHGMDGTGNGPNSANVTPRPRNYTDAAWQASVTDEQLKQTILKGGAAMGKSPAMPGQPQLADHPEVLDELVQIIRRFGKRP